MITDTIRLLRPVLVMLLVVAGVVAPTAGITHQYCLGADRGHGYASFREELDHFLRSIKSPTEVTCLSGWTKQ